MESQCHEISTGLLSGPESLEMEEAISGFFPYDKTLQYSIASSSALYLAKVE